MSTLADIAVEREGGTVVARLSGEVDMTNAARVRDQLLDAIPNDVLALVIDLGECRYLDSAAIEADCANSVPIRPQRRVSGQCGSTLGAWRVKSRGEMHG